MIERGGTIFRGNAEFKVFQIVIGFFFRIKKKSFALLGGNFFFSFLGYCFFPNTIPRNFLALYIANIGRGGCPRGFSFFFLFPKKLFRGGIKK